MPMREFQGDPVILLKGIGVTLLVGLGLFILFVLLTS